MLGLTVSKVCGPDTQNTVHAVETNRELGSTERLLGETDVSEYELVDELLAQEQS